jgi:hypothetical protein
VNVDSRKSETYSKLINMQNQPNQWCPFQNSYTAKTHKDWFYDTGEGVREGKRWWTEVGLSGVKTANPSSQAGENIPRHFPRPRPPLLGTLIKHPFKKSLRNTIDILQKA